jgi:hypothetical protein
MGLTGVVRRAGPVLCCGALMAGCAASPAGTRETDRQAETLAVAISWPRQSSAAGFARAALATTLGRSPHFSVLEVRDRDASKPEDPKAHLVIRIYQPGSEEGFASVDPVTACYSMDFNYYGIIGEPDRITCPDNAVAITPPPVPRRDIPAEHDAALQSILAAQPANPTEAEVMSALQRGLPAPPVDPNTNLAGVPPQVAAKVSGGDIGVSLRAVDDSGSVQCLFGSRVKGDVRVWRPPGVLVQPGETSCDPESALAGLATRPPH